MEPASFYQAQTDQFLRATNITLCGNDYTPTNHQAIRNLFAPPNATNVDPRPVFLAINGVSNSPSHQQWQLLIDDFSNGGGAADFSAAIAGWRNILDSVQAPPPQITNARQSGDVFEFSFPGQQGRTNRVESATMAGPAGFLDWTVVTNVFGTNASITFRETQALSNGGRFYRVRRL
ncbi:MAG TPA: hypothetical protein VEO53_15995 [Candidatus Binatia bacterium]|nr:hypothetical protein [Candidatus Binatia bacterium]